VCENEGVTALLKQGLYTERELMANRPEIIKIRNKKLRKDIHTDRCGNTSEQKCHAKGSRRENISVHVLRCNKCGTWDV
jgi:hypothetical protein